MKADTLLDNFVVNGIPKYEMPHRYYPAAVSTQSFYELSSGICLKDTEIHPPIEISNAEYADFITSKSGTAVPGSAKILHPMK